MEIDICLNFPNYSQLFVILFTFGHRNKLSAVDKVLDDDNDDIFPLFFQKGMNKERLIRTRRVC